jgi:hypothetical protein
MRFVLACSDLILIPASCFGGFGSELRNVAENKRLLFVYDPNPIAFLPFGEFHILTKHFSRSFKWSCCLDRMRLLHGVIYHFVDAIVSHMGVPQSRASHIPARPPLVCIIQRTAQKIAPIYAHHIAAGLNTDVILILRRDLARSSGTLASSNS